MNTGGGGVTVQIGWGGAGSTSTFSSGFGGTGITNVAWNYPGEDPEGGSAGVREPRRPILPAAPAAVALPVEA